jgi:DNA-binding NarL/FixJ family response regulator
MPIGWQFVVRGAEPRIAVEMEQTLVVEPPRLSPRELEVLKLASAGWTNDSIAHSLGVTVHAVKFHLSSIYRKLGVANRTEAAAAFLTGTVAERA